MTAPASSYERGPILLVSAAIIKDGQLLLTRHEGSRLWHLPDGQVRFGESTHDCLRRSLAEDLGLTTANVVLEEFQPVYISETVRPLYDRHYVTIHYRTGLADHGKIRPRPGLEIKCVTPSKALGMKILDSTRQTLVYMGFTLLDG